MTDDKRRPRPAAQYGHTGKQVADNVRRLRETRGLSIYALSAKLRDAGRPITPSAVAKIERAERQVTADDLTTLALVLNTSPISLLLPPDWGDTEVFITGRERPLPARIVWRWIRGQAPASDWGTGDVYAFPDDEEDPYLTLKEEYDRVTLPPELRRVRLHPAARDADLVTLHVERLVRLSERASEQTFADQLDQAKTAIDRLSTELDRMAEERALRRGQGGA